MSSADKGDATRRKLCKVGLFPLVFFLLSIGSRENIFYFFKGPGKKEMRWFWKYQLDVLLPFCCLICSRLVWIPSRVKMWFLVNTISLKWKAVLRLRLRRSRYCFRNFILWCYLWTRGSQLCTILRQFFGGHTLLAEWSIRAPERRNLKKESNWNFALGARAKSDFSKE